MALILHLDTNTEICSVALAREGGLLAEQEISEGFVHASRITLLIQACLATAQYDIQQLDAVALSRGPGSYTGLRVGAATAKGIAYALDIPLIAVDSLHALALAAMTNTPGADIYGPMIDARRMEVYLSLYDNEGKCLLKPEARIIDKHSFSRYFESGKQLIFCGNGAEKCMDLMPDNQAQRLPILSAARHLIPLAYQQFTGKIFADLAYFSPLYLKPPNITKPKKIL
ncbi:MAG: tRNA (adenosine(37)-N6)-threonylcarbamoyltransferase complex dimerization subunit type 1 TsaB [Bacteroidota bacterium]